MRLAPCGYLRVLAQAISFGRPSPQDEFSSARVHHAGPEALPTIGLAQSGFTLSPRQNKAQSLGKRVVTATSSRIAS